MALVDLRRALAATRRNEQALADRNRDLEAVRASLEEQMAARTQAAEEARLEAETANVALHEQIWHIVGLAHLSEIQPDEQDLVSTATAVLEHVCRYVDAAVGALYLWENERLVLTTGYAIPGALSRDRRFALGEGLIGQVAAEGRLHVVTAAASPMTLLSSFGEITLAQVYVYPLLYGGTVMGVLEIGGMTSFTPAETQFLSQAVERLTAIIHTLQTQARINLLLQETQQQAEELQAQEEELRATNEELQAQAEALRADHSRIDKK
jgi:transcriptional regulator with GAF, ATPase, and Fis domain